MGAFEGFEPLLSLWGELLKYPEFLKPPPEVGNSCWGEPGGRGKEGFVSLWGS